MRLMTGSFGQWAKAISRNSIRVFARLPRARDDGRPPRLKGPELASGALLSRLEHGEMRLSCRGNGSALLACLVWNLPPDWLLRDMLGLQGVLAGHDHRNGIC